VSDDLSRHAPALVEGEDFYREGGYVVFTAAYHLRRGRCCESGCRHCPYRVAAEGANVVEKERDDEASL
jgi:2-iminoacetate synthase ThiH